MLTVTALYIYPIKSLGGFSVDEATITTRGFEYDRRWMLIDLNGQFMTQREFHAMALLQTAIHPDGLYVYHKLHPEKNINISFLPASINRKKVTVWEDECEAWVYDDGINNWFSEMLETSCSLVYMPDETNRLVDRNYAIGNEITSFSDGYPFLIIGQASLDTLNEKLEQPLPINRFRPNIVFSAGEPYEEENWQHFTINQIDFYGVKTCSRCMITTIDQQTAIASKEPLKTLATYRSVNNKIKFGMNLLHKGTGSIKVGEIITVLDRK